MRAVGALITKADPELKEEYIVPLPGVMGKISIEIRETK